MKFNENNVFKDTVGRWRTQSVFREMTYSSDRDFAPIYTMLDEDQIVKVNGEEINVPSFRRLYLELEDPTEYLPATKLLGGWQHWEYLSRLDWFLDYMAPIREELEIRIRSKALQGLIAAGRSSAKFNVNAARYVADGTYKGTTRGRPSNAEVKAERDRRAKIGERVMNDMERLGLKPEELN